MGIFVETTSDSVILAAVDFSQESRAALMTAFSLARLSGARVRAVHVVDMLAGDTAFWEVFKRTEALKEEVLETARKELEAFVIEHLGDDHGVELEVRFGRPHDNLARATEADDVELLVMGTTGLGRVERAVFGSTATYLLRHTSVPLLMINAEPLPATPKRILVPVDFSECSRLALTRAASIARFSDGEVLAYNTMRSDPVSYSPYFPALPVLSAEEVKLGLQQHQTRLEELVAELGVGDVTKVADVEVTESVAGAILNKAEEHEADLICLGSHGRKGFDRLLLGSTAEAVIRRAELPVLVVRQ